MLPLDVLEEMRVNLFDPDSIVQTINGFPRRTWPGLIVKPCSRCPHRTAEHEWALTSWVCERCGITAAQFHNVPFGMGLPCRL